MRLSLSLVRLTAKPQQQKREGTKASKSGRAGGGRWSLKATKLDFPVVLISCSFFFVAGFFFASSDSFSRYQGLVVKNYNEMKVSNSRQLLAHRKSGDDFFTSIPFQVLSWKKFYVACT